MLRNAQQFGDVAAGCGMSFCLAVATKDIVMLSKSPLKTCRPNSFYRVSCNSVLMCIERTFYKRLHQVPPSKMRIAFLLPLFVFQFFLGG